MILLWVKTEWFYFVYIHIPIIKIIISIPKNQILFIVIYCHLIKQILNKDKWKHHREFYLSLRIRARYLFKLIKNGISLTIYCYFDKDHRSCDSFIPFNELF